MTKNLFTLIHLKDLVFKVLQSLYMFFGEIPYKNLKNLMLKTDNIFH